MNELILLAVPLFHAWRYSKTTIDPDWAYFNMFSFTGALYGRDFADCKTPAIHLWFWFLSKIVGTHVARVRFAHHFFVGAVGLVVYWLSGNFQASLSYAVLVNSGWLLAFHGNVGQIPAAMIMLSVFSPSFAFVFWLVALFFEPKLLLSFAVVAFLSGWWWSIVLIPIIGGLYLLSKNNAVARWVWESSVIIPARIGLGRKDKASRAYIPWFTANGILYLLPWVIAVFWQRELFYWFPAIAYLLFVALGKVVRQNHLIPATAWIAAASPPLVLIAVDLIASGFYFGKLWSRYYPALDDMNEDAQKTGEWLLDKPGSLYVNGIHSGIYVHSRKKPFLGTTEQIEIREVTPDRRKRMIESWRKTPPEWVVCGDYPGFKFVPSGYEKVKVIGNNVVYRKMEV